MPFTPFDLGYDLLPPDSGAVSPDLALAVAEAADPEIVDPADTQPLGRGWLFDFTTGQFVQRGGAPARAYELDQLAMWVEKTVRTARFAYTIYSDGYGVSDPSMLLGYPLDAPSQARYESEITNALVAHDRIVGVSQFEWSQDPDNLEVVDVSFNVVVDGFDPRGASSLEFTNVRLGGVW